MERKFTSVLKREGEWVARIENYVDGKSKPLQVGSAFETQEDAAQARDMKVVQLSLASVMTRELTLFFFHRLAELYPSLYAME
jgi:hypothetical protein